MEKSSVDISSKRSYNSFHWKKKVESQDDEDLPAASFMLCPNEDKGKKQDRLIHVSVMVLGRRKLQAVAVARLRSMRSALTDFSRNRRHLQHSSSGNLGGRVVGTLFGSKRGHVHFAFQKNAASQPAFLIELATPIGGLVKEMASGLVRIALECDKHDEKKIKDKKVEEKKTSNAVRLLEEPVWRTYCNGKKCGFATRRECGEKDWKILKAVQPISMGAGVLPGHESENECCEIMYMRAKFERIVGSRDSEAFYMMNPDSDGAPELSVYLLRV